MWPNKLTVSIIGSLECFISTMKPQWVCVPRAQCRTHVVAPQVLKKMVITKSAILIKVYCQFGKTKSGSVISMRTSINVAQTKTPEAQLASHPRVDIHPAE